jgi:phosphoesterase RecJ-like protein
MSAERPTIAKIIEREDRFLVAAHENPDGDAIGATAAMGWILESLGKSFALYNPGGVPEPYAFLALPCPIVRRLPGDSFQRVFVLDCGDLARTGDELARTVDRAKVVNIDHHLGNPGFGGVNWIDTSFSSVGEMVAGLARDLGVPLSGPLGEAVYLALVTDTGFFSYGQTTPAVFELAAEILRQGLDPAPLNDKIVNSWTPGRLKLWSRALSCARYFHDGQVGVVRLPEELLKATGTTAQDTDGVVNFVRRVKTVKVAVSLRESGPGLVKFSLRSHGNVNVQAIAAELGGGGHKNAAGGTVEGGLDHAEKIVVAVAAAHLGLS